MSKKIVSTYYCDVPGLTYYDERRLLHLWQQHWQERGWETNALSEFHARQHPKFEAFNAKIATFPTVNDHPEVARRAAGYEAGCFKRWLAISTFGGGFLCDFDVFETAPWERNRNLPKMTTIFQGHPVPALNATACPSLVWASADGYDAFADFILALPDGFNAMAAPVTDPVTTRATEERPHTSDMLIWRMFAETGGVQLDRKVWQHGEEGAATAPMIHFSRGTMNDHTPRWKHIPNLIADRGRT